MCGQTGIIIGNKKRPIADLEYFRDVFMRLLRLNQGRGHHATGAAVVNDGCDYQLLKRPMASSYFVKMPEFYDLMDAVNRNTTLIMGHTRYATIGSVKKTVNAHPIRSGCCLATVNGTIFNADALFKKFKLVRYAEVDSELVARLADIHAPDGKIKVRKFLNDIMSSRGQLSAIITSFIAPEEVIVLKGNKPLSLRYNKKLDAVFYSSENIQLETVLRNDGNWKKLNLKPMSCAVFNVDELTKPQITPFLFVKQTWSQKRCLK
jgi:glucosamine 6-phosphate synthetase-like amidotransferase/phosphosugar isomerase protein